jgi:hypothetical protein
MWQEILKRRKLANLINDWDDYKSYSINCENIPKQVLNFFRFGSQIIYPAKSYFVAIIYALCLEKYFGNDFINYLKKSDLLDNDQFFKSYNETPVIYDEILSDIDYTTILGLDTTKITQEYFKKEFLCS